MSYEEKMPALDRADAALTSVIERLDQLIEKLDALEAELRDGPPRRVRRADRIAAQIKESMRRKP